jgi:GT2 family glycosyltransferase
LSRARNAGVAATTAPFVAFTDDDCRVAEGWTAAVETAFADARVGFVTGSVVPSEDVGVPMAAGGPVRTRFTRPDVDPEGCGAGANMSFRRDALTAIGGFDEMLGTGAPLRAGEDLDIFWRLLRAGWEGIYDPDIRVIHVQWRSRREAIRSHYAYGIGGGAFAVKAMRVGAPEGKRFLRSRLWKEGLAGAARSLRSGYESGAAADLVRTAGTVVGALRATRFGLADELFAPRPSSREGTA